MLAGDSFIIGATPVPLKAIIAGLFGASCVIVTVPVSVARADGEYVTATEQLAFGARFPVQVFVCWKLPLIVMEEMFCVRFPVLVI